MFGEPVAYCGFDSHASYLDMDSLARPAPIRRTSNRPVYREINQPTATAAWLAALAAAQKQLGEIAQLTEPNWDGYDALPVTTEAITAAQFLLQSLALTPGLPMPQIVPRSSGTIGFAWENESGEAYIELGRTRYSGYIAPTNGTPTNFSGVISNVDLTFLFIADQVLYARGSMIGTQAYSRL